MHHLIQENRIFLSGSFKVQIVWLSQKILVLFIKKMNVLNVLDLHMNLCLHRTIPKLVTAIYQNTIPDIFSKKTGVILY